MIGTLNQIEGVRTVEKRNQKGVYRLNISDDTIICATNIPDKFDILILYNWKEGLEMTVKYKGE